MTWSSLDTSTPWFGSASALLAPNGDETDMIHSYQWSVPLGQLTFQPLHSSFVGRIGDSKELGTGLAEPHGV